MKTYKKKLEIDKENYPIRKKNKTTKYGRNRYKNMYEEDRQLIKEYAKKKKRLLKKELNRKVCTYLLIDRNLLL